MQTRGEEAQHAVRTKPLGGDRNKTDPESSLGTKIDPGRIAVAVVTGAMTAETLVSNPAADRDHGTHAVI